jgi:hypothetical protein
MKKKLTFEDGVLLCKHIYQSAIEKILNGVIEQEQIFYRTYILLEKLEIKPNNKRLEELLYILNIENIYSMV